MALIFNGTEVELTVAQLPVGYVKPEITTFDNQEFQSVITTFTVVKSTVENASSVTTFDNILVDLNAQISALLTNDLDVTNTVDAFARMKTLITNTKVSEVFYTNGAVNYSITVEIFYKTS